MARRRPPLARVSDSFIRHHPNPYIDTINELANSRLAKGPQQVPILPEMTEQVNYITQKLMSMQGTVEALLADPAGAEDHGPPPVQPEQRRVVHGRSTAILVTVSSSTAKRGPSRPIPESFTPP